jgi:CheY-like chemotaxis protein
MPLRKNSSSSRASALGNILLVDDSKLGLSARRSVLEELGHHISTASNGVDALEQFNDGRFDLVITNYRMPSMDGLELIIGLRKLVPNQPVILISGFVDALGLNEEGTGADVVIQKSAHEVSHLVRAVSRLLRKKPVKKPPVSEAAAQARRKSV